ncbi:MAG: Ppx/GppA family phosphatase [Synergistaceae bacterium]|jgi:exopolyphosphatase/guanosine-5'-triphosphate,3'-diphosphate pyrophosphatase|nr:Ppx/GppA family phosphatase [Synergistaceae bacterium]
MSGTKSVVKAVLVKAVIDVGTNSIKLHLAEKAEGAVRVLKDAHRVTRLGEGLWETGFIAPEPLERSAAAITAFAEEARRSGASEIAAVGTMALREAKNAAALIGRVKETARIDLKVISGDEEARLCRVAVSSGLNLGDGDFVVFDTGGGSTEFVYGRGGTTRRRVSVPVGAVYLTERFFRDDPVAAGSVPEAEAFARKKFSENGIGIEIGGKPDLLIGVGGAVTTLASVRRARMEGTEKTEGETGGGRIHGSLLEYAEVAAQAADYAEKTLALRRAIAGLLPDRADIVLAGACIVKTVMETLDASALTISARGLRHGLMHEMMNGETFR